MAGSTSQALAKCALIIFRFLVLFFMFIFEGMSTLSKDVYKRQQDQWQFDYVTDFSYQGPDDMAELVKEIDFNFLSEEYYLLRYGQMGPASARGLYTMWESNFVSYYQMGVFTVSVAA